VLALVAERRDAEGRGGEPDIRPLEQGRRDQYRTRWHEVQAEVVDDPARAVARADLLIQSVLQDRGYPVDDLDPGREDVPVDHPSVVQRFREGHAIVVAHEHGDAGIEELRKAFHCYRALFDELVEAPDEAETLR